MRWMGHRCAMPSASRGYHCSVWGLRWAALLCHTNLWTWPNQGSQVQSQVQLPPCLRGLGRVRDELLIILAQDSQKSNFCKVAVRRVVGIRGDKP